MYTPFPVLSKGPSLGFDPHSTVGQILKLLREVLRGFSAVVSLRGVPGFSAISS